MNSQKFFQRYIEQLIPTIKEIDTKKISEVSKILLAAYEKQRTIYVIGNGGSASTATHIASDLAKTVRGHKGDSKYPGFRAVSLSDNPSLITAWANDVGYEKIYSGQLENLGTKGDILIAISSSGNSPNIISCVKLAKKMKMKVIGISGFGGGKLKYGSDVALVSKLKEYGPVEDLQLIIGHMLTNYFYDLFQEDNGNYPANRRSKSPFVSRYPAALIPRKSDRRLTPFKKM